MRGIIFNRLRTRSGGTIDQENWRQQVRQQYPSVTFDNFVSESVRMSEASYKGPITFSVRPPDQTYVNQLLAVAQEFFDKVASIGE